MSINNNNFLMGVVKKEKKEKHTSSSGNSNNAFINELLKIQNSIRQESNPVEVVPELNKKNNAMKLVMNMPNNLTLNNKKSFKNILLGIIKKLDDDVVKVSKQIESYNKEKKSILEMDKKEILQLKNLTKKLYKTIMEIYTSLDVNKELRVELLEKLKKNIEGNKVFLKNINEINKIKPVGEILEQQKRNSNKNSNSNSNSNKNSNKNKSPIIEEEEVTEEEEEIPNVGNKTIFNIINENKRPKNNNQQQQRNGNLTNIQNTSSNEEDKPMMTLEEQIREKKINTSKKVSHKLNELNINKNQSRTLLNEFMVERTGTSSIRNNLRRNNITLQSSNSSLQSTPVHVSTSQNNNNIIL